jgi:hypothetical protein
MFSSIYAASSSASIASTAATSRQQKRVDFLTGYCGLSPPTLFKRIGAMAADGQPLPSAFASRRVRMLPAGAERTDLARQAGNPFAGTACPSAFTGAVDHLRSRHRPLCRPDLPERLYRRGSTTGNGWRSPSRRAGPSPPDIPGNKA